MREGRRDGRARPPLAWSSRAAERAASSAGRGKVRGGGVMGWEDKHWRVFCKGLPPVAGKLNDTLLRGDFSTHPYIIYSSELGSCGGSMAFRKRRRWVSTQRLAFRQS